MAVAAASIPRAWTNAIAAHAGRLRLPSQLRRRALCGSGLPKPIKSAAFSGRAGWQEHAGLLTFTIQDTGGGESRGTRHRCHPATAARANEVTRQPVPARHLTVGLQCGGSDGYSGITIIRRWARRVDLLVRHGGTAILSETPEIYGAEHLLTRHLRLARDRRETDPAAGVVGRVLRAQPCRTEQQPSAGNKAGGLTTILEKSLGAVARPAPPIWWVYEYANP